MDITISKIHQPGHIDIVVKLADEIWRQHFIPIIGPQQVNYMLEKYQSHKAITEQIEAGAEYALALHDEEAVGYTCLIPEKAENKIIISKLYVKREYRGCGIGTKLLAYIRKECQQRKLNTAWLTVNRFNQKTIEWYENSRFEIIDEVKKDIGGGFFMDDFIMQMKI